MVEDLKRTHFYVIVRKDISLADQMCQIAHACVDARFDIPIHCHLALLEVDNLSQLIKLGKRLLDAGIDHYVNYEPDLNDTATAICTRALTEQERSVLKHFRKWREPIRS